MEEKLLKKVKKVVDNKGDMALAQLEATIDLAEKLDELKESILNIPETVIPEFPEIPEPVSEISVTNLPEVQRVEVINQPEQKDDSEMKSLLKELVAEVKKKEEYAYDIEIDASLKEQLKGENGADGKDGLEITSEQVRDKIESLKGDERISISSIKNLDEKLSSFTKVQNITTVRNVQDGNKGDIEVSGNGLAWSIKNKTVTPEKMADVSTGTVFYRKTAGSGAPEVQSLSTLKTDLGLTGTNSGDQDLSAYLTSATAASTYEPKKGSDDNYVTDEEKSALHSHSNKTVLDNTTASFTTADESKLDGIESGAQVNVNADWNAVSGDAQILNKPTIPTVSDAAYGAGWNGDTTTAPSKNAVYDKIESLAAGSGLSAPQVFSLISIRM